MEKLERASLACSHAGGVNVAARNLLTEPRSAGNEETWKTLVANFPSEDHGAVSSEATEAALASSTEGEDENVPHGARTTSVPPRCSSTSSTPAAPSHPPEPTVKYLLTCDPSSTIYTDIGREEIGGGTKVFWRRIDDEPKCMPSIVMVALLAVEPHRIGQKVKAGLRGHDMEQAHHRRGYATGAVEDRRGQPRGEAVWGRRTRRSGACKSES